MINWIFRNNLNLVLTVAIILIALSQMGCHMTIGYYGAPPPEEVTDSVKDTIEEHCDERISIWVVPYEGDTSDFTLDRDDIMEALRWDAIRAADALDVQTELYMLYNNTLDGPDMRTAQGKTYLTRKHMYVGFRPEATNEVRAQAILHELGHAAGLEHHPDPGNLMHKKIYPSETTLHMEFDQWEVFCDQIRETTTSDRIRA